MVRCLNSHTNAAPLGARCFASSRQRSPQALPLPLPAAAPRRVALAGPPGARRGAWAIISHDRAARMCHVHEHPAQSSEDVSTSNDLKRVLHCDYSTVLATSCRDTKQPRGTYSSPIQSPIMVLVTEHDLDDDSGRTDFSPGLSVPELRHFRPRFAGVAFGFAGGGWAAGAAKYACTCPAT